MDQYGTDVDRAEYSRSRLQELGRRLEPVASLLGDKPLCIYATGSYGRLEAWDGSDIDPFFLYEPAHPDDEMPLLTFIRVAACLIEATEDMGFPPFSGDGRYLEVHDVDEMERVLGSPDDDSLNAFTARMLLILESRAIYGEKRYERILRRVVSFYYRDFLGHEKDFVPLFLTNDILRFWRTLTLNYEHDRFKISQLPEGEQAEARAKSALKNYKLKLSRMATCFSMVIHLASEDPPVLLDRVLELCGHTPLERFEDLRGRDAAADSTLDRLLATYHGFLGRVQRPEEEVLQDFRDPDRRRGLLEEASTFGTDIFELLAALAERERIRHLLV